MISCRLRLVLFAIFLAGNQLNADIIYLKNGKQIPCESAWEEGQLVKYNVAQGTISIPRSIVLADSSKRNKSYIK